LVAYKELEILALYYKETVFAVDNRPEGTAEGQSRTM
jgi:hypothetical protein